LTVTNNAPITTKDGGPASLYPSSVSLSDAPGTITAVRVTLHNINHANPEDYDILLVGPGGQSVVLMSDCGWHEDLSDVTITFSDTTRLMPYLSEIEPGTFRPTNYSASGPTTPFGPLDEFSPDQPRTYPSSLSVFTNTSPNGTWNLYVMDDDSFYPDGTIAGGWTLEVDTTAFQSTGPIVIPGAGAANPYPSLITVAGFAGDTKKVRITLDGLSHTFPDDLDIMVVGPGGQNAIIMSDVGGDSDLANVTLTFDDDGPNSLPDESQVLEGTYKPANFGGSDTFPIPAPTPSGTSALSVFNDTNPNGTWGLYIVDDHGQEMGGMDHWAVACDPKPPVLANISTRITVGTGDKVLIGGFIVSGTQPKKVILRAIGPSLSVPGKLANPTLELRDGAGGLIRFNDNWRTEQEAEIIASGIPPGNNLESAIVATLPANNAAYTVIVRGANESTGIGLVEVYDLDRTVDSKLANISTRGFVEGDDALIAGTIILGGLPQTVCVRGLGPSLNLPNALPDPYVQLRDANGAVIFGVSDWTSYQESEVIAAGLAPGDFYESAFIFTLPSAGAAYTVILERTVFLTPGIALVEIYALN
jgi:subtilisin-like proprotein convertase family protein